VSNEATETSDESPEGLLQAVWATEPDMEPAATEEEDSEHLPEPPDELAPIQRDMERIHLELLDRIRQLRSVFEIEDVEEAAR
jgi:hypothetical protein